ncbi:MAG: hypothetical protein U0234_27890 [Sandaracinus sp.]
MRLLSGVLALVLWATAPQVSAQSTDLVVLSNGGRLRGTVTEYEPGRRLVITLSDGTTRTISAGEIASVSFSDGPAAEAPLAVATTPVAPPDTPIASDPTPVPPTRWSTARSFGAPHDAPWDNEALGTWIRRPRGDLHFGLQADAGVALFPMYGVAVDALLGAAAMLDVTIDSDQTFRIAGYFAYVPEEWVGDSLLGGATLGARALFGIDFADVMVFRAGGEGGVAITPGGVAPSALGRFEIAARLTEPRSLEIGVAVVSGLSYRSNIRSYVAHPDLAVGAEPLVFGASLFAAWVFE